MKIPFIDDLSEVLIDTLVKPRIEYIDKVLVNIYNINYAKFIKPFQKYIKREYSHLIEVSTIVNISKDKLLTDIYQPLSIRPSNTDSEYFEVIPNELIDEKSFKSRKIIVDNAGMGKSTLLKWIFIQLVHSKEYYPVFIELRKLSKEHTLIDEIVNKLSPEKDEIYHNTLTKILNSNKFVFLLDGYDEVQFNEKSSIAEQIENLSKHSPLAHLIASSRPGADVVSLSSFQEFRIRPLSKDESFSLLAKYDSNGTTSSKLIDSIKSIDSYSVYQFLTNPLLASLLFTAFDYKNIIPLKQHLFYRQVYDALYETHDLTKSGGFIRDKYCKLGIDEMHEVLRCIAYLSYIQNKNNFSKDELLNIISKAAKFNSLLDFEPSNLLRDLVESVPLITMEGLEYKWTHKSIQEYFMAYFIFVDSGKRKSDIFKYLLSKNAISHYNMIDILSSLDRKSFNEYILLPVCNYATEYKNKVESYTDQHRRYRAQLAFSGYITGFVLAPDQELEDPDRLSQNEKTSLYGFADKNYVVYKFVNIPELCFLDSIYKLYPNVSKMIKIFDPSESLIHDITNKFPQNIDFTISYNSFISNEDELKLGNRLLELSDWTFEYREGDKIQLTNIDELIKIKDKVQSESTKLDWFNLEIED